MMTTRISSPDEFLVIVVVVVVYRPPCIMVSVVFSRRLSNVFFRTKKITRTRFPYKQAVESEFSLPLRPVR